MRRDEALAVLGAHREELRALGVAALYLFGSVARDEARPDSDVDLMVELARPMGMFAFFRLWDYLEAILAREVDLATPDGLDRRIQEGVMCEAIRAA